MKKQWYLLCYDIREEKRLKKFHYRLSKQAMAMQKSVFLVEAGDKEIQKIIQLVDAYTHTHEDDVRLYPIEHPKAIWSAGIQNQSFRGIATGQDDVAHNTSLLARLLRRLSGEHA
ncbi:CRISPR-associated endonuclease Cas2 [Methylotuvimicrobium sp. KM2]|uniref:CRISPR-associated endonuclease Cas2 n=1 Tax=Methylotuvimicrobium sp. KM2 TaxID=3133976 RepID=UPI0031017FA2